MKRMILILAVLIPCAASWSQPSFNARSMGMGGAYHGMARGADVSWWNPANLALPDQPKITVDIVNFGLTLGNNSLNLEFYNDYFSKDYFDENERWDDAAKAEIISRFDDDFKGYLRVQATPIAVSYQQFAFAVNSFAYSNILAPQNLVVVPLEGLGTEPVPLDADGEGVVGTEIAMSVAKVLHPNVELIKFFSVGATFKYFIGHAYFKVEEATGSIQSSEDSLKINGHYTLLLAAPFDDVGKGGDGVGLDLGAVAKISDKLTFGLSLNNIIGAINFGEVEARYAEISYNEPGINIDNLDRFGDFLEEVEEDSIEEFRYTKSTKYKLPKNMVISANYRYNHWLTLEADYQQGLNETAGCSKTPRLALGTEIRYLKFLPFRIGFALGGYQRSTFAIGFGLDLNVYKLDIGLASQRGLFAKSKGINFALSQRLQF